MKAARMLNALGAAAVLMMPWAIAFGLLVDWWAFVVIGTAYAVAGSILAVVTAYVTSDEAAR